MQYILSLLPVLACPIGMGLMMWFMMRGGVLFPPGIFLDGEPFSYGRPSERKLRRELERRRTPADEDGTRAWCSGHC